MGCPTWSCGRLWLLRLGYYKLTRAKEQGTDWVWIIDHTVQIGSDKCFVILGIRLGSIPPAGTCIRHEDVERKRPVCNRMIDAASRFFASRQYALATQEQAQRTYAEALGFCPLHTWQLEAMSSPQGLSQGFPRLMERLSADLTELARSEESRKDRVLALVQTSKGCRVCRLLRETERAYLSKFAAFIETPEGPKIYTHSQGLCLRHLGLLIDIIPSKEVVRFLIEHSARMFAQISEDMQNYALKRDALRSHTRNLDEEDAYLRGLVHSVRAKKVCFPWELDTET